MIMTETHALRLTIGPFSGIRRAAFLELGSVQSARVCGGSVAGVAGQGVGSVPAEHGSMGRLGRTMCPKAFRESMNRYLMEQNGAVPAGRSWRRQAGRSVLKWWVAVWLGWGGLAMAQTYLLNEGFGTSFPAGNGWTVGDGNASAGLAYWASVDSAFGGEGTHSGNYKGYCAGVGNAGTTAAPRYTNYMDAYMSNTLSLTAYSGANLSFWYKIPSIETGWDYARVWMNNTLLWSSDDPATNWTQICLSLKNYAGTNAGLRFQFYADSVNNAEGWYLDDVQVTVATGNLPFSDTLQYLVVTNYSGYLLDSDSSQGRDSINAYAYYRTENFTGLTTNHTSTLSYRLINATTLQPHPLRNAAGGTNADYTFQTNVVVALLPGTNTLVTNLVELRPAARLDQFTQYYVECRITNYNGAVSTRTDAARDYYHFTNLVSGDAALNTLVRLTNGDWSQTWAVQSIPGQNSFAATVGYEARRWDDLGAAEAGAAVPVVFSYTLRNAAGTVIPLVSSNTVVYPVVTNHDAFLNIFTGRWYYYPTATNFAATLRVRPTGQLDSVSNRYYLTVAIAHTNNLASHERILANSLMTATQQLAHPNGHLWFGSIDTTFTSQAVDPFVSFTGLGYLDVWFAVDGNSGQVVGNPSHTYGTGAWLETHLFPDGHAELASGSVVLNAPSPDTDSIAKLNFQRGLVTLDNSGGRGDITLFLPPGFSYRTNNTSTLLTYARVVFRNVTMSPALDPAGSSLTYNPGASLYFCEETKPVWLQADALVWGIASGQLAFTTVGAQAIYVRGEAYDRLMTRSNEMVNPPDMATKRSNERYYQYVNGVPLGYALITTDPQSNAVMTTALSFDKGSFLAHYPYDTQIAWDTGGFIAIVNDQVTGGGLSNAAPVLVPYSQGCEGCGAGASTVVGVSLDVTNHTLLFSVDGGLLGGGDTVGTVDLKWGQISAANYAQQALGFRQAAFHMPGAFIRGDKNPLPSQHGPVTILYTGVAVSNLTVLERPAQAGYLNGFADYAGLNFRCLADKAHAAKSTIAGKPGIGWQLTGRSKYYIRYAGVSGIHEAFPGTFPTSLTLYGYRFTFTNYGLSYLDSNNKESRTDGTIYLPYPSDFTQAMDNMKFNCMGAPESADVPRGDGFKMLKYWLADFETHTIQFESTNGCDPSGGYLVLGVDAYASHVKTNLYGFWGFKPNGNLIPGTFNLPGVDSRLQLPNNFAIEGANHTTYVFCPTLKAYLNNWEAAPPAPAGTTTSNGWMNIIGTVDVPFFEDLKLQLQTSCRTNGVAASNATIHLAGGWPRSGSDFANRGWDDGAGHHFFNTGDFDADNNGWPQGATTIENYRNNPTSDLYHPRAQRKWLDVVPLDYPLTWDSTLRQFKSWQTITNDLLVIKVQHQVTYMDAKQCSLDFGMQYDGLPKISLANMVFNAIDEETGVAKALIEKASQPVYDILTTGLDEMNKILDTQLKSLMDGVFDRTVDPVIDDLYQALHTEWNGLGAAERLNFVEHVQDQCLRYVTGTVGGYANNLNAVLLDLANGTAGASNLISQLRGYLRDATNAINAVTDGISMGTNGAILSSNLPGLLSKQLSDYPIAAELVGGLVETLAKDYLDAVVGDALNRVLQQADPSLQQIRTVLNQARDEIMRVDAQLGSAGNFTLELQQILSDASGELAGITARVMGATTNYFGRVDFAIDDPFAHYSAAEIKGYVRQKIEDEFFGSQITAQIQSTLRSRVYELDATMRSGVDSVFQQFNDIIRSLIGEYLAELDNSINGLLGQVSDVIGAGKIDGHAVIDGDSLKLLRLDGHFQWKAPDAMEFGAFLEIKELGSDGTPGCSSGAGTTMEVTLGAEDLDFSWIGSDLKATIVTKFTFDSGVLVNLAGSVDLKGEISFEAFKLYNLAAGVAFGKYENYLALRGGVKFNSYDFSGAIFFGRTCTLDPLKLIDPDVADVLGEPPFTGAYCYAQGWIPVSEAVLGIPASCFFRISAGIGAGAFYFLEGPTYGGKMFLGVEGEALCVVTISGEIMMIGVKHGDDLQFKGRGSFEADIGPCPFCFTWSKSVELQYKNKQWHID